MIKKIIFIFAAVIILGSCNEEIFAPIFYTISHEGKPNKPYIQGTPTNFAVLNDSSGVPNAMYVANGNSLYRYTGSKKGDPGYKWNKVNSLPSGIVKISQIASTGNYVYMLCYPDMHMEEKAQIWRFNGSGWDNITINYETVHYIYAAGGILFVGASAYSRDSGSQFFYDITYTVLYVKNGETTAAEFQLIDKIEEDKTIIPKTATGEISGAAFNGLNYYVCTRGSGIFETADPSAPAVIVAGSEDIIFNGMLYDSDSNTIFITRRGGRVNSKDTVGDLFTINSAGEFQNAGTSVANLTTGALAVWTHPEDIELPVEERRRLLLAGRQDSLSYSVDYSFTNGYLELELNEKGIKGGEFNIPGRGSLSTIIGNYEYYDSMIRDRPLNFIFQTPYAIDNDMTLFASTQLDGLWSYRQRSEPKEWQWNAEEN
uniref:Lipoprotein n=1 Tax=uncultured bacterium contig00030 TaxID=1181519 RepID=A0A806KEC1_9BACT|nr:hypothetical protein [uncultured bacterium contig00030]